MAKVSRLAGSMIGAKPLEELLSRSGLAASMSYLKNSSLSWIGFIGDLELISQENVAQYKVKCIRLRQGCKIDRGMSATLVKNSFRMGDL